MIQMALKELFFLKNYENFQTITQPIAVASSGWVLRPRPPSVIHLIYINYFTAPLQFNTYFENINFWFKSSPLATSCLRTNLSPRLLTFYPKIFLSHKKSLLLKIYDDIIFHVICGLVPSLNKKSWLRLC